MDKAIELIKKHLGEKETRYLSNHNEPLWDSMLEIVNEALGLGNVSSSCGELINEIKNLKRFDDIPWEEGGNSTREYSLYGSCIDADELNEVISNYC